MSFVSDRWRVEVRWLHDKPSHTFPNSTELSVYTTFGLCDGLQEFWQTVLRLMWRFCFTRIRLSPLSSKILYHDSVSVIVSRFTSSLRTLWSAVITSPNYSAGGGASPVRPLQGALVTVVLKHTSQSRSFWKWVKILCFLDFVATVAGFSRCDSGELCADACNSVSFRFSLKSCNQSGRSASGSFDFFLSSLFLFWF